MEDLPGNCPGVWTDRKFPGITPQHVVAGKEGSNQGVVAVEVLHDDAGHPHGGLGVARGVESANNPKDGARSTNENAGQNSPRNRQPQMEQAPRKI
jgi:hypothetical protein